MEDKELMNNMSTNIEELREAEELYKNCLIVIVLIYTKLFKTE